MSISVQDLDTMRSHPPLLKNDPWREDYADSSIPVVQGSLKRKRTKITIKKPGRLTSDTEPSTHRRKAQIAESSDEEEVPSPKRPGTTSAAGRLTEDELRAMDLADAQARLIEAKKSFQSSKKSSAPIC